MVQAAAARVRATGVATAGLLTAAAVYAAPPGRDSVGRRGAASHYVAGTGRPVAVSRATGAVGHV